MQMCTNFIVSH